MTSTTGVPTLRQHQLAKELKTLREEVGFTRAHVAERLNCSVEKIGHIERARNIPSEEFLAELLFLYGYSDRFDVLNEIRTDARRGGLFSTRGLPSWLKLYLGWEEVAIEMERFTLELIPGALQSESYGHKIAQLHDVSPPAAERHIASRLERRKRLETGEIKMTVILSEAALRRTLGMGTAGVEQLRHLQEVTEIPSLQLFVLPFDRGAHQSMAASFTLLHFMPGMMNSLGYYDYPGGGAFVDDQVEVEELTQRFKNLNDLALEPDSTIKFIDDVLRER